MTARSPSAFALSALLHAAAGALLLFGTLLWQQSAPPPVEIFEMVAGPGDNYGATVAPALGTRDGSPEVSFTAPPAPEIRPAPTPPAPAPTPAESIPEIVPKAAPTPKAAATKEPAVRDFSKDLTKRIDRAEDQARAQAKKAREAAQKEEARRKKEAELAKQRMTVEEFQKLHGGKTNASQKAPAGKSSSVTVQKIDAKGIAGGVVGGSTANTKGGAGGTALSRDIADAMSEYLSELAAKVKQAHETPPGTSEDAVVKVEITIGRDGRISGVRLAQSSGDSAFDESALVAFRRVVMSRPPPNRSGGTYVFRFNQDGVN